MYEIKKRIPNILFFLVGMMSAFFIQNISNKFIWTSKDEVRVDLSYLRKELITFRNKCNRYPSQENGLSALVDPSLEGCSIKQLISIVPLDSEGGAYEYVVTKNEILILSSTDTFARINI